MTQGEILKEYARCLTDIPYYGLKYCTAFDQTRKGIVPLDTFPKQKELLKHYTENRFSIVLKPRQAGVSTITALFCAHMILFAPEESPQKILIIANKQKTAIEFMKKLRGYIDSRPKWLDIKYKDGNKSAGEFEMSNGSGAKAQATSDDAVRGYTPTVLVMDEAAFIERGEDVWTAAAPALSTGGRAILLSTPNGYDPLYFKIYDDAIKNKNDFKVFEMNWYHDPRFNKDLKWTKIVKEPQENSEDEPIIKEEIKFSWDFDEFPILIQSGYKPTSEWFETMKRTYSNDARKIAQELECDFLGSGDNVVKEEYIQNQKKFNNRLPKYTTGFDGNLYVWEDAEEGHQYIMGVDVSRGDSADYSTMVVFDITSGSQVMEWQGHVPPDILGDMANQWGRKYQALLVVDITGGMGQGTVKKLLDLEYPNIHYTSSKDNKIVKERMAKWIKQEDLVPGFIIGTNRVLLIQALEYAIRENQIAIRSDRFIQELKTFVYINGKADHKKGFHDDIIMATAMLLYVLQHSFQNLEKYKAQTIAMLNAWDIVETTRPSIHNSDINPNIASEYAWLFK